MSSTCQICGCDIPDSPLAFCPTCLVSSAIDFQQVKPGSHKAAAPDVINALIPEIEIVDIIGQGGMGTVYLGLDGEKAVAVKILAPELVENPELKRRFERESEILASLDHPGIVPLHHAGKSGDILYLVMDFIEGQTLDKRPPKNEDDIAALAQSLCAALHYAHQQGITHRDLKPSNILWDDATGTAKIADFGLAKNHLSSADATLLTSADQALGTPRYMAPEQWLGKEASPRSDLYALGAILYELLTSTVPVGSFKKPSLVSRSHPKFDQAIMRALATDPCERYATVEEFALALGATHRASKWPLALLTLIPLGIILPLGLCTFWPQDASKSEPELKITVIDQPPAASALRDTRHQYFGGIQIESDGTRIISGAPCSSETMTISGSGYSVIHLTSESTLEQLAVLKNPTPEKGDRFGYSVDIEGQTAVCGAWGSRDQLGTVYIFRENQTWELSETITPPSEHDSGRFGFRVALQENTLVISATDTIFIYIRSEGPFQLTQVIEPPEKKTGASFARSISLDGEQLAIGFMRSHNGLGSAVIYRKHEGRFLLEDHLTVSVGARNSQYLSQDGVLTKSPSSKKTLLDGSKRR